MVNRINKLFPSSLLALCSLHLLIALLFFIARVCFYIYYSDDLIQSNLYYYIQSFFIGFKLDLIVSSYLLLPVLFTIFLPKIGWDSNLYKSFLSIYSFILFATVTIFCSINLEWFNENGNHINTMIMLYGGTGEVRNFILEEYNVLLYLIIWAVIIITTFKIFNRLKNKLSNNILPIKYKIISFICSLLLTVIFMRGGFPEKPLDWGYAYFSKSNMANLAAQNPIFFFGRSFLQMKAEENYHTKFLAVDNLEEMNDDFSNLILKYHPEEQKNSLNNINGAKSPNIMLIILESFVAENCNYLNKNQKDRITPFLDSLSKISISFTNCYANGIRSAYGLSSILTSWPVLPGKPIITQVETGFKNHPATEYPRIFKKLGYDLTFLYGGDANFDNMKGFAIANGFDHVLDWNDGFLANKNDGTMFGKFDHIMFDKVIDIADGKGNTPFMINFFTTTNHEPFRLPESYESRIPLFKISKEKYIRAKRTMAYNDIVLSEFFEEAKKHDWYNNTIFIITADHGLTVSKNLPNHPRNGHIPFIIFSDLIDNPKQINKIVSQVDIIPTIIDIIGEDENLSSFYGVSGLKKGGGFACRMTDEVIQWINNDYIYYELFGTNQNHLLSYNSIWDTVYTEVNSNIINDYKKESHVYIKNAFHRFKHNNY